MDKEMKTQHKWLDTKWLQTKAPKSESALVLHTPKSWPKYAQRKVANLRGMEKNYA